MNCDLCKREKGNLGTLCTDCADMICRLVKIQQSIESQQQEKPRVRAVSAAHR
jgi:hypothetical protein